MLKCQNVKISKKLHFQCLKLCWNLLKLAEICWTEQLLCIMCACFMQNLYRCWGTSKICYSTRKSFLKCELYSTNINSLKYNFIGRNIVCLEFPSNERQPSCPMLILCRHSDLLGAILFLKYSIIKTFQI